MRSVLKNGFYLHMKGILLLSIAFILLLSYGTIVVAAPFLEEPGRVTMFFSWGQEGSGSFGDNEYGSYSGTSCGVAIPMGPVSVGFKTAFDTSEGFYEVFADYGDRDNLLINFSLLHRKDETEEFENDVQIIRLGASRSLVIDLDQGERIDCAFGPGLSITTVNNSSNFSMFLQAKSKVYLLEGSFLYVNGLYDVMYNSGNFEAGVGFSY